MKGRPRNSRFANSTPVLHHRHKPVIHVHLLMAMKQRRAWIISDQIHLDLLARGHHDYILHDSRRRLSSHFRQLEGVPVQMHWVSLVTLIIKPQSVALIGSHQRSEERR